MLVWAQENVIPLLEIGQMLDHKVRQYDVINLCCIIHLSLPMLQCRFSLQNNHRLSISSIGIIKQNNMDDDDGFET
jgi:hypothetical protein